MFINNLIYKNITVETIENNRIKIISINRPSRKNAVIKRIYY
jgi:hypothetical protein